MASTPAQLSEDLARGDRHPSRFSEGIRGVTDFRQRLAKRAWYHRRFYEAIGDVRDPRQRIELRRAYSYAKKHHKGQVREEKDEFGNPLPYIMHPINVGILLRYARPTWDKMYPEFKVDKNVRSAAYLHDVPERSNVTIDEIERKFGEPVAFYVDALTKKNDIASYVDDAAKLADLMDVQILVALKSFEKLLRFGQEDPRVYLLKLADVVHNGATLEYKEDPVARLRIANFNRWVFDPLAREVGMIKWADELRGYSYDEFDRQGLHDISQNVHEIYGLGSYLPISERFDMSLVEPFREDLESIIEVTSRIPLQDLAYVA